MAVPVLLEGTTGLGILDYNNLLSGFIVITYTYPKKRLGASTTLSTAIWAIPRGAAAWRHIKLFDAARRVLDKKAGGNNAGGQTERTGRLEVKLQTIGKSRVQWCRRWSYLGKGACAGIRPGVIGFGRVIILKIIIR